MVSEWGFRKSGGAIEDRREEAKAWRAGITAEGLWEGALNSVWIHLGLCALE